MLNSFSRAEPLPRPCPGDMVLSSLWLLGLALSLGAYEQRVSMSPLSLSMWKRNIRKGAISSCSQSVGKTDIRQAAGVLPVMGLAGDAPALCVPREPHSTAAQKA